MSTPKKQRFPELTPESMSAEQRAAAEGIIKGPRGGLRGPFNAWLRSPVFADRMQKVGEYLRFKCPLDRRIAEMSTLMAARHWTQQYEWQSHYKHAMKAGLNPAIAQAIAEGRRPTGMAADEEALYDMLTEVLHNQSVCDATYARALGVFGEQGVIELVAIAGYYAMLAMVLNVGRKALPAGQEPQLPWFPN